MSNRKKRNDPKDHVKDCGAVYLYKIVDPCDMIAMFYKCEKHNVIDYVFPKQVAIVWPDGQTEMWWKDNE